MGRQTRRGARYGHPLKIIRVTKSPRLNCYDFFIWYWPCHMESKAWVYFTNPRVYDGRALSVSQFSLHGSVGWRCVAVGLYSAHGVDREDAYIFIFAEIFQGDSNAIWWFMCIQKTVQALHTSLSRWFNFDWNDLTVSNDGVIINLEFANRIFTIT